MVRLSVEKRDFDIRKCDAITPSPSECFQYGLLEGKTRGNSWSVAVSGRAAVDQVLSRLAQRGALLRAGRGIYVLPVESRASAPAPSTAKMVEGLASQRGETIVSHGASAANALGLTTQVPMRSVYLTSGPSRRLKLGAQPLSCDMRRCGS